MRRTRLLIATTAIGVVAGAWLRVCVYPAVRRERRRLRRGRRRSDLLPRDVRGSRARGSALATRGRPVAADRGRGDPGVRARCVQPTAGDHQLRAGNRALPRAGHSAAGAAARAGEPPCTVCCTQRNRQLLAELVATSDSLAHHRARRSESSVPRAWRDRRDGGLRAGADSATGRSGSASPVHCVCQSRGEARRRRPLGRADRDGDRAGRRHQPHSPRARRAVAAADRRPTSGDRPIAQPGVDRAQLGALPAGGDDPRPDLRDDAGNPSRDPVTGGARAGADGGPPQRPDHHRLPGDGHRRRAADRDRSRQAGTSSPWGWGPTLRATPLDGGELRDRLGCSPRSQARVDGPPRSCPTRICSGCSGRWH